MTAISVMNGFSSSGPTVLTRSSRRATTLRNVSSSSCGAHDLDLAQLPLPPLTLHPTQTPPQDIPLSRLPLGAPQPPASGVCRLGGARQEWTRTRRTSRKLWLKLPAIHEQCALLNVDGSESESLSRKNASQTPGMRLSLSTLQRSGLRCSTPHCTTVLLLGFRSVSRLTSHSLTC
jgi:hypothetical protein